MGVLRLNGEEGLDKTPAPSYNFVLIIYKLSMENGNSTHEVAAHPLVTGPVMLGLGAGMESWSLTTLGDVMQQPTLTAQAVAGAVAGAAGLITMAAGTAYTMGKIKPPEPGQEPERPRPLRTESADFIGDAAVTTIAVTIAAALLNHVPEAAADGRAIDAWMAYVAAGCAAIVSMAGAGLLFERFRNRVRP